MYDITNREFTVTVAAECLHYAIQKYYEVHQLAIIEIKLLNYESLRIKQEPDGSPSRPKLSQVDIGDEYGC